MAMMCQVVGRHDLECENQRKPVTTLAARGRSRKDGFTTVGAVCDRPYFVNSRKNARSQTAPTIDTANSTGFCHGLLGEERPFAKVSRASRTEIAPSISSEQKLQRKLDLPRSPHNRRN